MGTHYSDQTLDPAAWESLARQAGESGKAHAAFLDYVRMGPGRSLRKLHGWYCQQSGNEPATESPPTQRLRTLADWSVRFTWQKRLAAYKAERDRRDQERWEERRRQVRERDWAAGEELRDLAAQVLAQAPQFVKTTRRLLRGRDGAPDREVITLGLDADALLKTLKLASELQRQAAEVPPPAQRLEHTGRDGGPIQAVVEITSDDLAEIKAEMERWERERFGPSASNGQPSGAAAGS